MNSDCFWCRKWALCILTDEINLLLSPDKERPGLPCTPDTRMVNEDPTFLSLEAQWLRWAFGIFSVYSQVDVNMREMLPHSTAVDMIVTNCMLEHYLLIYLSLSSTNSHTAKITTFDNIRILSQGFDSQQQWGFYAGLEKCLFISRIDWSFYVGNECIVFHYLSVFQNQLPCALRCAHQCSNWPHCALPHTAPLFTESWRITCCVLLCIFFILCVAVSSRIPPGLSLEVLLNREGCSTSLTDAQVIGSGIEMQQWFPLLHFYFQ